MPRKILIVSPKFHQYWSAVEIALQSIGYETHVHCYDRTDNLSELFINRLIHDLPDNLSSLLKREQTHQVIKTLRATKPDIVFVIKGDQLETTWWDELETLKIPVVVWLYDELANMSYSAETLQRDIRIASYSTEDIRTLNKLGLPALYLPDGFDSFLSYNSQTIPALTFIGARYPSREKILTAVNAAGVPTIVYGKEWSRHPWDVITSKRFKNTTIPSKRDLSRADYYGVMAGSIATLNLHGTHRGFNMRTFESPGVGGLQIIDRTDIEQFYAPGKEVLTFSTIEEIIDLFNKASKDVAWANNIRNRGKKRTLNQHTFVHRMRKVEDLWA